ncbi:MAG: hypothetical protein AAF573_09200 [Bacteroidota bacterium]
MKKFLFITLCGLLLWGCGNDNSNKKQDTSDSATVAQPNAADQHDHDGHDHAGHSHDATTHVKASPLSRFIGVWKYDRSTYKPDFYKNRWIELFADGTFENGIGGKQTNRGKWTWDEKTTYLDLDYEDNSAGKEPDEQWRTMNNSPTLILMGNTPKNPGGGQMKLDRVNARPTE